MLAAMTLRHFFSEQFTGPQIGRDFAPVPFLEDDQKASLHMLFSQGKKFSSREIYDRRWGLSVKKKDPTSLKFSRLKDRFRKRPLSHLN